ncbi:hypothetical protein ABPG75_013937 [Micractinium tetrahymenae]
MAAPSVGGAAAVSALFFCFVLGAGISFRLTRFRVYLLLGLSCIFRCIGYAVRAANIHSFSNAKAGTYLALASAGYGVSLAVICLLLGCWWKNSDAGARLRRLSVGSRLLIAPIIIFGPISGAVLAGLIYGDGSPGVMSHATTLRVAVTWGMLAVLIVLAIISLLGLLLAWRGQRALHRAAKGQPGLDPDMLILVMLAACGLLLLSASFRAAALYHQTLPDHDNILYPVQVLPELLEVLLLLWPTLMPRAALGRGFARWWAATHGPGDGDSGSGEASRAATKATALEEGSKSQAGQSYASMPSADDQQ